MEEKCICCGEVIPEGRQVCPKCEGMALDMAVVTIDKTNKEEEQP